ncbi:MAG: SUMF1/EgtB/PvdO family nonheme iron enzyme, partial [Gemmatimonadota bacterium]|nr:SUMF1/EgtB/PvdO family nonheme iron enzyme [Gemmatimonadota bacterium]
ARSGWRLPTDAEWTLADSNDFSLATENVHNYCNIGSDDTEDISALKKALIGKKTVRAGVYPLNHYGLYNMQGNVWEWCSDYRRVPRDVLLHVANPQGPDWGCERILRGGSFMSLQDTRGRGYRTSIKPEYKSRFTGFRICRSTGTLLPDRRPGTGEWFETFNSTPEGYENTPGELPSLLAGPRGKRIESVTGWDKKKKAIREKWMKLLGPSPDLPPEPNVKLIRTFREDIYTGKMMYLQVEEDSWEKIYLMIPHSPVRNPAPVVIVPYYDVDTPAGKNLGGRVYRPMSVRSFAYLMVQQGFIAVAVRWFGESYGESYGEAVANLKLRHPELSGLGKWVWDSQRLLDYIYTLPMADHDNIGIIGHSLGGKMAFYASAFDERITAVVGSEFGIGLNGFTNYYDYWYHGGYIRSMDKSTDHHELLGLIAPRPFLLIGGDSADDDRSWHYINSAKEVYSLYGKPRNLGYFNHRTGHSPTPEAVRLCVEWLKHFLQ